MKENVTAWTDSLKDMLMGFGPDTVVLIIAVAIFYYFLNKWSNSD